MRTLIVVNEPGDWPLNIEGVDVVAARAYLTDPEYSGLKRAMVFNLCRSYRYQSTGYYVSLLAAARDHRRMPGMRVIQGMKSAPVIRQASEDMEALIQRNLKPLQSDHFVLSIYFGRNMAERYNRLARQLFNIFRTPLLRASFGRDAKGHWHLRRVTPMGARDIPDNHRDFVIEAARAYFAHPRFNVSVRRRGRYDLAILHDPQDPMPPSDDRAMKKFVRAARDTGLEPYLVEKEEYGRIAEYDALFIRETTAVQHYTFRFAQRAAAEGLVVIDDPRSILRCTNKVFLAELLARHRVPAPRTVIVSRDTLAQLPGRMDFPLIIKQPDSSFSQGVVKVDNEDELWAQAARLLEASDLILAQEYTPTEFDWRVGVLDRRVLYVCRYFMAPRHWQIIKRDGRGRVTEGEADSIPVADAPHRLVDTALRAANLIGDGLYGVDLKEIRGRFYVIEINDNPSIDAGYEDGVLGDELYREIMRTFVQRIEKAREDRK
jgi:glutathione synthase/RimK-type ligase-like ATP-grasp enzyme